MKELAHGMIFLYCYSVYVLETQIEHSIDLYRMVWFEPLDVYLLTLIPTTMLQSQVSGYKATLSLEDACAQLK